jgi:acyl carrier protein
VTRGVDIKLTALFEGRDVQPLDLSKLVELTRKPELPPTTWLINGGGARPQSEVNSYAGKLPPLSLETARASQEKKLEGKAALRHAQWPGSTSTRSVTGQHFDTLSDQAEGSVQKGIQPNPADNAPAPVPQRQTPASTNFALQSTKPLPMSTPTPEKGASQPTVPPTSAPNYPTPVSGEAALIAYQAYQQTMRQFLSLQEKVMQQFLSGGQMGQIGSPLPAATPTPMISPAHPTLPNGRHNGNGVVKSSAQAPAYQPGLSDTKHNGNGVVAPPVQVPTTNGVHTPKPVTPPQVTVSPTVEPVIPSSPPTPSRSLPNRGDLIKILLQLVSDRTGYPTEMLGLDQDMEAELGIDSIKRVEILGALQKTLPESLAASVQSKMESLTRVKSLNGIVEQLLSSLPTVEHTPTPTLQTSSFGTG